MLSWFLALAVASNVVLVGQLPIDRGRSMAIEGTRLYVASESDACRQFSVGATRVDVVDVADPRNPRLLGSHELGCGAPRDVAAYQGRVYVATGPASLGNHLFGTVIGADLTDPTAARRIEVPTVRSPVRLARDGGRLYVATETFVMTGDSGFVIVDVAMPDQPRIVGRLTLADGAGDVVASGGYAYIAYDGMSVVDVADPTRPAIVGSYRNAGGTFALADRHLYAQTSGYLRSIDVTEPTRPTEVGLIDSVSIARMSAAGAYLYAGQSTIGADGLAIYSLTDSARPSVAGSYPLGPVSDVEPIGGHVLALADGSLYALTFPAAPRRYFLPTISQRSTAP